MRIDSIALSGFRNFKEINCTFIPDVNVITGQNAQGKTNLLESVYLLAAGRSFRARSDRELIGFDAQSAAVRACVYTDGRDQTIALDLNRGRAKRFSVNGVRQKSFSQMAGRFTAVLFCPDDLSIIREGAAARRRLLDGCICQLRPRYAAALSGFNRTYEQKTRILRDWREKPDLLAALDAYSEQLARFSAELIYYRAHFVRRLSEEAGKIHQAFSGGREALAVRYLTVKTVEDPMQPPRTLYPQLLAHWQNHRQAEIDAGQCLSGAHKDDLDIQINGLSAKSYASQGQTRTAALSLKLGEREIMFREKGEYPVLLLDDVLSELDADRQSFVLNRIAGGQVLITCCDEAGIFEKTGGKIIRVEKGTIL